jgi:hypothetical protein
MSAEMVSRINDSLVEGRLPCAVAFRLAQELGVEPLQIGQAADALGVRISKCQLGLFGYESGRGRGGKILAPAREVPLDRSSRIRHLASGGDVSCASVFRIAQDRGISRLEAANAVAGLGYHIVECQLGCFKRQAAL